VRLRVLVYNVKGFRRGANNVARAISHLAPDVALLQECGPRRRLKRFAGALGMDAIAVHRWFRRSIHDAVLVRPPWRVITYRLHRFPRAKGAIPRGALVARIGRAGTRLWVFSTHLGLHPGVRRRNAEELMNLVLALDEPAIVGGDLNEGPDGKAASWLAERLWDAWAQVGQGPGETFPGEDPTARIDYLFASEKIQVHEAAVIRTLEATVASDHLPLVVDVALDE
jgi:endonuclease/exonuclease/phosphatase family metal-dependent hydrolase